MRRLVSYNVFEGDPNLIAEGQILVIRDASVEGKIIDIQQRVLVCIKDRVCNSVW